jgi:alkylation response protein AidB-like acyl-CoA dehydrogenase
MTDGNDQFGASFLVRHSDPETVVVPDDLGEEERMLVRSVVEFGEREVAPVWDRLEARDPQVVRDLFEKAAELGLFIAEVPEEMGGLDLNVLAITGMCSSPADIGPMGSVIFGHQGIGMLPIVNFGKPDQIERYLAPCMEGEKLSAFALTEPSSGSDAMNIQTRAVLNEAGTHYVINGSKQWITNAGWADIYILFAKVDGEHFTAFIVDRDSEGFSVGEPERLLGQHGSDVSALTLEDVEVPVENVLGEVGMGHKVAFCTLNMGRLKLSASSATGAAKALAAAAVYAGEREQFGRPIAEFGLIQRKLADMAARAWAAESVSYRTAGLVYHALEALGDGGKVSQEVKLGALAEFSAECAMAKVFTSEAYNGLADTALQVFGGYGFSEEYPPARMYRDSRITRIYEGTNEICRLYAQREVFKRWARGALDPKGGTAGSGAAGSGAAGADALSALKSVYWRLASAVAGALPPDQMGEPANQQYLASLADVAIEIFAAESALLRVSKLEGRPDDGAHGLRRSLATLCLDRAVTRIREEAHTILGELFGGDELAGQLGWLEATLPGSGPLLEARAGVAAAMVEREGHLPAMLG